MIYFLFFSLCETGEKKFWQVRKKCFFKDNFRTFVFSPANIFFSLVFTDEKKVP